EERQTNVSARTKVPFRQRLANRRREEIVRRRHHAHRRRVGNAVFVSRNLDDYRPFDSRGAKGFRITRRRISLLALNLTASGSRAFWCSCSWRRTSARNGRSRSRIHSGSTTFIERKPTTAGPTFGETHTLMPSSSSRRHPSFARRSVATPLPIRTSNKALSASQSVTRAWSIC